MIVIKTLNMNQCLAFFTGGNIKKKRKTTQLCFFRRKEMFHGSAFSLVSSNVASSWWPRGSRNRLSFHTLNKTRNLDTIFKKIQAFSCLASPQKCNLELSSPCPSLSHCYSYSLSLYR